MSVDFDEETSMENTPQNQEIPESWSAQLESLVGNDAVWFVCETNLDQHLQFKEGVLVLLENRLIHVQRGQKSEEIPIRNNERLQTVQHQGIGKLELVNDQKRLRVWPFTISCLTSANGLVAAFNEGRAGAAKSTRDILKEPFVECDSEAPASRSLFRLWAFAKPHLRWIVLGLFLTLAGTAAGLIPPYLTMPLVDQVLVPLQNGESIDPSLKNRYLWGFFGAIVVAWLLSWARKFVLALVSEHVAADLRDATFSHLMRLSLEYFGGKRTGDLISRISSDTDRVCSFISINIVDFVDNLVMMIMTAVIMITIDVKLALMVLIPVPVIAWLVQVARIKLRHDFGRGYYAWGQMISVLGDTIPGIRVVKAFAQEQHESEQFSRVNRTVRSINNQVNKLWALFDPTIAFLTGMGTLVVWIVGANMIEKGDITVGVLTAFLAYIVGFYSRLESMSRMLASVQRASAATHRVFEILDRKSSVPERENAVPVDRVRGEIEFKEVSFSYGSRQVIHSMNLQIRPGEMIGLVGASGAGKSTFINLVCRFYDIASGEILIDGEDIRSLALEEYRANIGIVLQEPFLFYGTIAENIAYGKPGATQDEIVRAARAANAHEFILRQVDGYDSLVGERGQSLSGGERQRISIARALLIDPRILILDEATSSVDSETEREIQEALDFLVKGRTTVAIAHRLSTLRNADRIVVLDRGEIIEIGPHETLLKRGGTYRKLYEAQFSSGNEGDE